MTLQYKTEDGTMSICLTALKTKLMINPTAPTFNYIQNTLADGEKIGVRASVSFWFNLPMVILGVALCYMSMGMSLVLLVAAFIDYFMTEIALTNRRLILKTGFVSRHADEIPIERITGAQLRQGVIGRFFGFGAVIVICGDAQLLVAEISKPEVFYQAILNQLQQNIDRPPAL